MLRWHIGQACCIRLIGSPGKPLWSLRGGNAIHKAAMAILRVIGLQRRWQGLLAVAECAVYLLKRGGQAQWLQQSVATVGIGKHHMASTAERASI